MKTLGIRQAKAHLSQLVREAARGECSIVSDRRRPVAMIGPLPPPAPEPPSVPPKPLPDAAAFRRALLGAPHSLDLDF